MRLDPSEVRDELRSLRRGQALGRPQAALGLTEALRERLVGTNDNGADAAVAVVAAVRAATDRLSETDQQIVRAELNLAGEHSYATLTERQESLAATLKCTSKTVRRRADQALTALAFLIAAEPEPGTSAIPARRPDGAVNAMEPSVADAALANAGPTGRPVGSGLGPEALSAAESSAALLVDVATTDVDPLTMDDIEERVDALANGYFRTGPRTFREAVLQLRRRVQTLVKMRSSMVQRQRLYAALASLTAMVAESSFAIGDDTDVHCAAAVALAQEAGHGALLSWVRGTQAQIALHTRNPVAAVRYACAGQDAPRGSTASVRAASYLARAHARRGDRAAARAAWRSAEYAWERVDGALTDSVFSLTSNYLPYCELTMLAWLGEAKQATRLADEADRAGDSPTVGRAISQVDVALVRLGLGEVEEAVRAGHRALAIGEARFTTPLWDRAADLVAALAPYDIAPVEDLRRRWAWISA